jgi:hypothetical protein
MTTGYLLAPPCKHTLQRDVFFSIIHDHFSFWQHVQSVGNVLQSEGKIILLKTRKNNEDDVYDM